MVIYGLAPSTAFIEEVVNEFDIKIEKPVFVNADQYNQPEFREKK